MGAKLDQHFLADEGARDSIVAAAGLSRGERVVEVGPGRGVLTRELLRAGCEVSAFELDRGLAERLAAEHAGEPRLRVVRGDFLRAAESELPAAPFKVVANLPYAVASPILQRILSFPGWTLAVLMFQKEVAERVAAAPGGPDYGLLTLSTLLRAETEYLFEVPRSSFRPPPRVDSAVVRLRRRPAPLLAPEEEKAFFAAAKAAFAQRRKMAAGVLAGALNLPRARVEAALARLGVPAAARPAEIPFEAFLRLPRELGAA